MAMITLKPTAALATKGGPSCQNAFHPRQYLHVIVRPHMPLDLHIGWWDVNVYIHAVLCPVDGLRSLLAMTFTLFFAPDLADEVVTHLETLCAQA